MFGSLHDTTIFLSQKDDPKSYVNKFVYYLLVPVVILLLFSLYKFNILFIIITGIAAFLAFSYYRTWLSPALELVLLWRSRCFNGLLPDDETDPRLQPYKGLPSDEYGAVWLRMGYYAHVSEPEAELTFKKTMFERERSHPNRKNAGEERFARIEQRAFNEARVWRDKKLHHDYAIAAFGAKGFATSEEMEAECGPIEQLGIYIGGNWFWNKKGHLLTVGSSRAGKGTNLIIPNLISEGFANTGSSFICLDPKGENAAITARSNKEQKGIDVHILNPFGIGNLSNSRFNPFDLTNSDAKDVIEFCDMMAEMVIPFSPGSNDTSQHFNDQGRLILSAFMLHMLSSCPANEANFTTLFKWSNLAGPALFSLLADMVQSTAYRGTVSSIIGGFYENMTGGGERETSGILSTIRKGLAPFKSIQLQEATETSDFDLKEIATKQMGIYICLLQEQMEANAVWMRIIIGASLKHLQRNYNKDRRVLYILDEFPTLGYMRQIEQNMGFIAGMNVSFWVIVQSLVQLKDNYPKSWETFSANAHIKHFMKIGRGDITTCEYVSKLMPLDVVMVPDLQGGQQAQSKPLLSPNEVPDFPFIICFVAGIDKPCSFDYLPYYMAEGVEAVADPSPFI